MDAFGQAPRQMAVPHMTFGNAWGVGSWGEELWFVCANAPMTLAVVVSVE